MSQAFRKDVDEISWWHGPLEIHWSVPPAHVAPPENIVREIRSFWAPYVPLFCRRVFLAPDGQKEGFEYHVIGMWSASPFSVAPDPGRILKHFERPSNFPFHGGVVYEQYTLSTPWPDESWQRGRMTPDIPASYPNQPIETLPSGWWALDRITSPEMKMEWGLVRDWIRQMIYFWRDVAGTIDSKFAAIEAAQRERFEREGKKIDADADYKFQQWRGIFRQAVAEGRLAPLPQEFTPQSFAFFGGGGK